MLLPISLSYMWKGRSGCYAERSHLAHSGLELWWEGRRKGSGFGLTGDHVTSLLGDQTLGSGYVKGRLVHAKVLIHSPANYAEHWCSLLKRSETPFARCHLAVDPTEYYKVRSSPNTAHSMPPQCALGT